MHTHTCTHMHAHTLTLTCTHTHTHTHTKIGSSLFDEDGSKIVGELVVSAEKKGVRMHFPTDFITGDKLSKDAEVRTVQM